MLSFVYIFPSSPKRENSGILSPSFIPLFSYGLYFLLSVVIKLEGLEWKIPFRALSHIATSFLPTGGLYWILKLANVNSIIQMPLVLLFYYLTFYGIRKLFEEPLLKDN